MQELWLPVVGWEGLYEVSDHGRVRSLPRTRRNRVYGGKLMLGVRRGPYWAARLRDASTGRQALENVHVLIAAAFIGPRPAGQVVRHGPNGSLDNSVGNLCYGTQKENHEDKRRDGTWAIADTAARRILTSTQVIEIYTSTEPSPALAARYGVNETTIRKIWTRKNWGSITCHLPSRAVRVVRASRLSRQSFPASPSLVQATAAAQSLKPT